MCDKKRYKNCSEATQTKNEISYLEKKKIQLS